MLKRSTLFAIAASLTLGLAAVSATDASAGGHGGGMRSHAFAHGARHFVHHPRAFARHAFARHAFVRRNFVRPYWKWAKWRPYWRPYWAYGRPFCWRHPYAYRCHPRVRVLRVGGAAVVGAAGAAAVVSKTMSAPVSAPQPAASESCLTQTRLADGNSLFRNVCTNEAAITSNPSTNGGQQEQPPTK